MSLWISREQAVDRERKEMLDEVDERVRHAPKRDAPVNEFGLRRVPTWLLSVDMVGVEGWATRTHGFVVVGHPGKGARSGASYYSISSDEKRGGAFLDARFVEKLNERLADDKYAFHERVSEAAKELGGKRYLSKEALHDQVREAIRQLAGNSYLSREDFCSAYVQVRNQHDPGVPLENLVAEFKELAKLVPEERMELWIREPNGPKAPKPNLAERDLRTFEQLAEDEHAREDFAKLSEEEKLSGNTIKLKTVNLRRVVAADPLALLEAKRQNLLQRLYVDELHRRDGSGWGNSSEPESVFRALPEHTGVKISPFLKMKWQQNLELVSPGPSLEERKAAAAKLTPLYQRFPPMLGNTGNCNSGAAELLRNAGLRKEDIRSPGEYNWGLHHSYQSWQPVKASVKSLVVDGGDLSTAETQAAAMAGARPARRGSPGPMRHARASS
jgi:hypothetical protein